MKNNKGIIWRWDKWMSCILADELTIQEDVPADRGWEARANDTAPHRDQQRESLVWGERMGGGKVSSATEPAQGRSTCILTGGEEPLLLE